MASAAARLDQLIGSLTQLATGQSLDALARQLGETALELVDEGFERGRAPSGRRWQRPKVGRFRPMIRTGALRASYQLHLQPHGFTISSAVPYARFLQRGVRGRLTPRKTLPDRALSRLWDRAFRTKANDWIRSIMERRVITVR